MRISPRLWLIWVAVAGGLVWMLAISLFWAQPTFLAEIELLLLFGVAVTTPLALRLAAQPNRNERLPLVMRVAAYLYPVAVLCVGLALALQPGILAALFACGWMAQTILLALYGLKRLLARPIFAIEEVCIDMGLLYVPISGVWLLAYAADVALLTFDPVAVILTAVHFTFISPGALVIIGMMGRRLYGSRGWRVYRAVASLALLSPALVAAGITLTQFSGRLWLEAGAVVILAGSFLLLASMYALGAMPQRHIARAMIALSAGALLITMGFALAYSLGRFGGWWLVPLTRMVRWHGWLNAVGFVGFGLLAWNIDAPVFRVAAPGIPFSRLPWRWHIGPAFFQRIDALDANSDAKPTGIVDQLADYVAPDFAPDTIRPAIKYFYEHTAAQQLWVYPQWHPGFRLLAYIYKQISSRLGQMNFPTHPETTETLISSDIVPLRDDLDGRERVRGWVRVYTQTGQAVYVAAYASHHDGTRRYMNIAFPLPFGNLTSILRLETLPEIDGGLRLTSFSSREGDQGVYFAAPWVAVRLPINETLTVHSADVAYATYPDALPRGESVAEHKMWLFGLHFLTLHYSIAPEHAPTTMP